MLSVENTLLCMFQRLCTYFQDKGYLYLGGMYFRGIAADSKFQEKMKGYLLSEGYLFTGFYGSACWPVVSCCCGLFQPLLAPFQEYGITLEMEMPESQVNQDLGECEWMRACLCVCVCVCVFFLGGGGGGGVSVCLSQWKSARCVCLLVCVCVTMKKKVPDEWQAWQATPAILQVSSSKHNAKKITTRVRGPFHQSITAILTEEKREEKQFTKSTHVAVFLFRDLDRDRSRL